MLCDICKKNPATVHVCEIINGKSQKLNLCLECVAKRTLPMGVNMSDILKDIGKNIPKLPTPGIVLPGLTKGKSTRAARKKTPDICCEHCKTTLAEYRKTGLVGCAGCYDAFHDALKNEFVVRQRSRLHSGKLPVTIPNEVQVQLNQTIKDDSRTMESYQKTLDALNCNLNEVIRREEYELAAEYRDKILEIQQKMKHLSDSLETEDC